MALLQWGFMIIIFNEIIPIIILYNYLYFSEYKSK